MHDAGVLQQEVVTLQAALQTSEDSCKSLQVMLQQGIKERTALQQQLATTSKLPQQPAVVETPQNTISWGKSSAAVRQPTQQHRTGVSRARPRQSAQ